MKILIWKNILSGRPDGVIGPHLILQFYQILSLFSQKCQFSNSNLLNAKTNYLITKIDY